MPTEQKSTRKLRAILSADVKGYSLLMTDDELATIQTLKKYRNIMSACIEQHGGRVVDAVGDNLLAEFESAVDAVQCSVGIQKELKDKNQELQEDKRLTFRIGVNIGDVIQDGDRIFGEGVNIAARIECIADAGGVCISRNAYDHIKNKLELECDYIGEHEVKNIKEPVRVYKVLMDSDSPKCNVEEKLELPEKPSIAVLPFNNMSGDPNQEYFSDGLTEQIINGLCKVSNLFVIARNSSFAYKGRAISIKQIAKELGVKYILEGSVQKAGDRVRITAQLIDATTDYHMWSENYDRELEDIFALQDEITMKLMNAMQINLTYGEQAYVIQDVTNIKAYDKYMRGLECSNRINEHDNVKARNYFEQAFNLDESSALICVGLGFTYIWDFFYNWGDSPKEALINAERCAQKAFALNDSLSTTYQLSAFIHYLKKDYDLAIIEADKAVALNPNGAEAIVALAFINCFAGDPEKGLTLMKRAFRLNPVPPSYYYNYLGMAYSMVGQLDKAIEILKQGINIDPKPITQYLTLATCYIVINQSEKAKETANRVLEQYPNFSLEYYKKMLPYKSERMLDIHINALRKAGLPD